MTRYLIDIRLMGPVKHQVQALADRLQEQFCLGEKLVVPHITLAGPFGTRDEAQLVADFTRTCSEQAVIPRYEVGGYGFFADTRVVYVTITPDDALRQFRYRLATVIAPYCTLRKYDLDSADAFRFHATLAMKLDWLTFQRIRWFFRNQDPVSHRHHPIRATLLKNSKILCEYDFARGKMLSRAQARSRSIHLRDEALAGPWDRESPG